MGIPAEGAEGVTNNRRWPAFSARPNPSFPRGSGPGRRPGGGGGGLGGTGRIAPTISEPAQSGGWGVEARPILVGGLGHSGSASPPHEADRRKGRHRATARERGMGLRGAGGGCSSLAGNTWMVGDRQAGGGYP